VVVTDAQDDADLDLLAGDYDDDGDDAGEVGESERVDASPQYDLQDFTYAPPAGSHLTEIGQTRINAFAEFAHQNNMAPETFEASINFYNSLAVQEQARQVETDKSARADLATSLRDELGSSFASFRIEVDAGFKGLPKALRTAMKSARLPDGRLLVNLPETMRMLRTLGARQTAETPPAKDKTMLRKELRDISALMNTDIDAYRGKPWRSTGKTASDRRMEIMRELGPDAPVKPTQAELSTEERELRDLHERDPQVFEFAPWKQTGRTGAQRLYDIMAGRG
jgi:hypothetical protein